MFTSVQKHFGENFPKMLFVIELSVIVRKPQVVIVRALQYLNVNKSFVSRTIARYRDTGSVARRQGKGQKKTTTSAEIVRKVQKRLDRNTLRNGRKMVRKLNISQYSIRQIWKYELVVKPLKFQKVEDTYTAAERK